MIDWREAAHNRVILGVLVLTLMIDNAIDDADNDLPPGGMKIKMNIP